MGSIISGSIIILLSLGFIGGVLWQKHKVKKFTSANTPMLANAQICQNIVEDQLNYLIRIGLDFKEGEKDSVRDNLYRIVAGKLQHV